MWSQIKQFFKDLPAQQLVAQLLFERGFQVNEEGKVVSGGIEIPHTQIGKEVGVERRAVDSTVQTILSRTELKNIYMNLQQVCSLQEVAREFNLSVIVFVPGWIIGGNGLGRSGKILYHCFGISSSFNNIFLDAINNHFLFRT